MGSLLKRLSPAKKSEYIKKWCLSLFVLMIGIVMVTPFVFMVSISIKPESMVFVDVLKIIPDEIYLRNYIDIFFDKYYKRWYFNSLLTVMLTVITRSFVVTVAAYAFARLNFRGRDVLFLIILSGMLITPETTIIAKYLILKQIHLTNTIWAIIIPGSFQVFFLFLFRQFFLGVPVELSQAALIDGCSHFKIYYKIILPLTKPALITMGLFSFIWIWNDFINPFIFITSKEKQLVTVGLKYFVDENTNMIAKQMAGASLGVLPPIILFLFAQKQFLNNVISSGIKG